VAKHLTVLRQYAQIGMKMGADLNIVGAEQLGKDLIEFAGRENLIGH
jgi:hypothetical protein